MATERFLWCVAIFTVVHGYPYYQDRIPNGYSVPNPCNPNAVWQGVGHMNEGGGGARNPFGLEFERNGYVWTQEMCRADSDGDGRSNGAELGDPDCTWREGSDDPPTTDLSHPGICEPLGSATCQGRNDFLDCSKSSEFVCDAINKPGIIEFEARLTETAVPAQETTYMCQSFEFDTTKDYHIVAVKPIIDNINVMHHAVIYGCSDELNVTEYKTPQTCFMGPTCEEFLFVWVFGGGGTCVHENAGFRVGANGIKRIMLEMHWNNPEEKTTYRDSSGMTLYMTSDRRIHDAGTMIIGQNLLVIPPGKKRVTATGTCTSMCSEEQFQGPIHIFGVLNHMHFLGDSAVSKMWSATTGDVTPLAVDEVIDYNSPTYYSYNEPLIAYPGDEFTLECHFKSTSRRKTTFSGAGSSDEMCYAFLSYYPRRNGTLGCTSTGNICDCEWDKPVYGGCDKEYLDPNSEKGRKVYSDVGENCKTSLCLEECLTVVRELKKNPCFQYPMTFINQNIAYQWNNATIPLPAMEFYYKMDSCVAELEREAWMNGHGRWPDYASGSGLINLGFLHSLISVILVIIM